MREQRMVSLVHLFDLVYLVSLVQPNTQAKPSQTDQITVFLLGVVF